MPRASRFATLLRVGLLRASFVPPKDIRELRDLTRYRTQVVRHDRLVFPWPHDPRTLWAQFTRLQQAAGIHLTCREKHAHTPSCHVYGFHDFRRAFATVNAPRLKPEILQRLMRHKSYQTTQKFYINPTSQMQDAVTDMPLPNFLKRKAEGLSDVPEGPDGKRPELEENG